MGPVQGTANSSSGRMRCRASSCQGDSSTSSSSSCGVVSSHSKAASAPCHGFSKEMQRFWQQLPLSQRCTIMRVGRKELFQRIRENYCSRCFGAFQLRYDELRSAQLDCPMCREAYAGLVVTPDGSITLDPHLLAGEPWDTFAAAAAQRRRRDEAFAGDKDVCGSSWQKKAGEERGPLAAAIVSHLQPLLGSSCLTHTVLDNPASGVHQCGLHTYAVPPAAFMEFWGSLPPEAAGELLVLPEEDFVAELDAHMKYQLKICKDCHFNVVRAFKDLKAGREVPNATCSTTTNGSSSSAGAPAAAATPGATAAAAPGASTAPPSSAQADSAAALPGSGQPCVVHQCNPLSSRAAAAQVHGKSRSKQPSKQPPPPQQQEQQQAGSPQPHGPGLPGDEASSTAAGAGATGDSTTSSSGGAPQGLELSPGIWMSVAGGMVTITQAATSMRGFFDAAEDVQVNKVCTSPAGAAQLVAGVRHAETPELAVGVLREAGLLIFRAGVEVAYREQMAAHNALLLFVVLVLDMMGGALRCAAEDVRARAAAEELVKVWDDTPATTSTKKGAGAAASSSKKAKAAKSKASKSKAKAAAAAAAPETAPAPKQQQQGQQWDDSSSAAACAGEQQPLSDKAPGTPDMAPTTPAAAAGAPELLLDMDKLQLLALQEGCVLAEEEERPAEEAGMAAAAASQAGGAGAQQGQRSGAQQQAMPPTAAPGATVQQQQQQQQQQQPLAPSLVSSHRAGPGLRVQPPPPPPPGRPSQQHKGSAAHAAQGAAVTGRAFSCDLGSKDAAGQRQPCSPAAGAKGGEPSAAGAPSAVVGPAAGRATSPCLVSPTSSAAAAAAAVAGGGMGGVHRTLSSCSSSSTLDAVSGAAGALLLDDPTAWPSLGAASSRAKKPQQRSKQSTGAGVGPGDGVAAAPGAQAAHLQQQQHQAASIRQAAGALSRTSSLSSSLTAGSDGHWVLLGGGCEEVADGRRSSCSSSHGTAGSSGHPEALSGWEVLGVHPGVAAVPSQLPAAPPLHAAAPQLQGQAGGGGSCRAASLSLLPQACASIQPPWFSMMPPCAAAPASQLGAAAGAAVSGQAAGPVQCSESGGAGRGAAAGVGGAVGGGGFSLFTHFPTSVPVGGTGRLGGGDVDELGWRPGDSWVAVGRPHAGRLAPGGSGAGAAGNLKMPAKPVQDSSNSRVGGEGLSSTYSLF